MRTQRRRTQLNLRFWDVTTQPRLERKKRTEVKRGKNLVVLKRCSNMIKGRET